MINADKAKKPLFFINRGFFDDYIGCSPNLINILSSSTKPQVAH
jgi:hypothetical protein